MELYNLIVKKGSGKNTNLDKQYIRLIEEMVERGEEMEMRCEIYNLVIKELFLIDDGKYFVEIKYRFTDREDPNTVILDVLSRYSPDEVSNLIWSLKKRLEEFVEEDFFKRFYP